MLTEIPNDSLSSDDRVEFLRGATKYYRAWTIRLLWISALNAAAMLTNAWLFAGRMSEHRWWVASLPGLVSGIGVWTLVRAIPGLIVSFRRWQAHVFLLEIVITRKPPDQP
jgi:hypothetical protein